VLREQSRVWRYRVFRPLDDPRYVKIDLDFDSVREADDVRNRSLTSRNWIPELRLEGARHAAEVRVGDDAEDGFAWSGDPDRERAERPDGATEAEVDGELAAGEKPPSRRGRHRSNRRPLRIAA
jgi:hypothetical protein